MACITRYSITTPGTYRTPTPTFVYLQEMARIFGLEVLHMADTDVLPLDYVTYGKEIESYLEAAKKKGVGLDFAPAMAATARFSKAAEAIHSKQMAGTGTAKLNDLLRDTETAFIAEKGLPNRPGTNTPSMRRANLPDMRRL